MSEILEVFYSKKDTCMRIRQKSSDLRQIISTLLQKDYKKYDLQLRQLKDTEKKDKYKIYGELITAYGYSLPPASKELTTINYYDGTEITIPLDPEISPIENAKNYYNRYSKLKRTWEALSKIIPETKDEIDHLESIRTSLELSETETDLNEIKEELAEYGYIKKKKVAKKKTVSSLPLHYVSSDGFHIYVGKNNFQNEESLLKSLPETTGGFTQKKSGVLM
jgi:predicted ribosome quality control (RQC) complex YloA/Tae2 family protein